MQYKCEYCGEIYDSKDLDGDTMCPQCLQPMEKYKKKKNEDDEQEYQDIYEKQYGEDDDYDAPLGTKFYKQQQDDEQQQDERY